MPRRIVLVSGHVASGKSSLADALARRFDTEVLKTHEVIRTLKAIPSERVALQRAGDQLDRQTHGDWVATGVRRKLDLLSAERAKNCILVVDSVKIREQCDAVRRAYGLKVVHVHLYASEKARAKRYKRRVHEIRELEDYKRVLANRTERNVEELQQLADIVIDTERSTPEDVLVRVASRLGLYGREMLRTVDVLVGGQWGSEGKGNIAGYLAPEYDVLVRVGGPNAGHKVYREPNPDVFYHLPSGTNRAPHTEVLIGPGATLAVRSFLEEVRKAQLDASRLRIDPGAMIIEPSDLEFESKGLKGQIGSTGQGVGSATARKILRTSAKPKVRLAKDVKELRPFLRDTLEVLDAAYAARKRIFLEGTQGTALSLHHGDYPYVTSRDTTVSGCLSDAGIAPARVRRTIMVCRTYPIRVGNPKGASSGPMGLEIRWSEVARRAGLDAKALRRHERTTTTNRPRRVAEFNWELLRKAASLNGPTDVALSFTDYLSAGNASARRFEQLSRDTIEFVEEIERVAGAPVSLIVTRFNYRNIIDRRSWD